MGGVTLSQVQGGSPSGGYPIPGLGVLSHPKSGGYPVPGPGGTLSLVWGTLSQVWGYPIPGLGGTSSRPGGGYSRYPHHPDLVRGIHGTPLQTGMRYPPNLRWGTPQTWSGVLPNLRWGTPQTWGRVPPYLDLGWGTPHLDLGWGTPT